jgi:hypothetical protein
MSDRLSLRDRLATYFKARPHQWIDGRDLATVGGVYAWRSRCSDCRLELHMNITNRQRKVGHATVSEYCYTPPEPSVAPQDAADLNTPWGLR